MEPAIAVIDLGSNTIKLLVARRDPSGQLLTLVWETRETRIGGGMSGGRPAIPPETMAKAVATVSELVHLARASGAVRIRVVATSAARDADNGREFSHAILEKTGIPLEIISGEREATLIGKAVRCDKNLSLFPHLYLFDLGGGSLECLAFCNGRAAQVVSLPLGAVRLTEKHLAEPLKPFPPAAQEAVAEEIRTVLGQSGFRFDLPPEAPTVATGGTMTAALAIKAAERGIAPERADHFFPVGELAELFDRVAPLAHAERLRISGLPAGRADVFPTALTTLLTLAEMAGQPGFFHSPLTLRHGLAYEMLEEE